MAARIIQWVFSAFLLAVGGYLAVRGAELIALGGSWYYTLTGLGIIAVAVLVVLRNAWGPRLWAVITLLTVAWSIYEGGLDILALLPRLAAFVVVGLWFITPWSRAAMRKDADTTAPTGGSWALGASAAGALLLIVAAFQGYKVEEGTRNAVAAGPAVTDWRHYGNAAGGTRFAQVDQLTVENVGGLKEVWRYRTGVPYDFKMTPLQIGDLIYICTAANIVIALDAQTGAERWKHDTKTAVPGASRGLENASTFARTCRGLSYHEGAGDATGQCARRIMTVTTDARMLALDAATGQSCREFGFDGVVNLKSGLGPHPPGEYMPTSTPLIAGDNVVIGGWVTDNQEIGNVSGVLRAYNAVTGAFVWAWDMGNPGYRGLPDEGGEYTRGTPNIWSNMSYDPQLNMVFAPTGNASPDYFGGKRRAFDETYSASTVALDAATGEMRWSYQTAHHDIWDWDTPSQPVLVEITKDGQRIPALAQPTKRGEIFLLDRRDGTPLYPATTCPDGSAAAAGGECPVPQGGVEGDYTAPTQPFSGLPSFRPDRLEKDMWGLTPLDQLVCRIEYKKMRYEGHFTPPMRGGGGVGGKATFGGSFQFPGNAGGFNWPSVSVDADNGLLIAQPMMMGNRIVMQTPTEIAEERKLRIAEMMASRPRPPVEERAATPPPQAASPSPPQTTPPQTKPYTAQGEWDPATARYGNTSPFMSTWTIPLTKIETGLPCFEPPYGKIAVIDLNTNKLLWSRNIGTIEEMGPFGIGTGLPINVGTPIYGGTMTTRGGLIFQVGTMDSTMRALDLRTGKTKWSVKTPGTANSTPITYVSNKDGRQYVVILVPNPGFVYPRAGAARPSDDQGGYVIGYALPEATAN
ncbi:MAG: PQQ-binding-like beta-propeller repeat protein [Alphaproteobacteria bacterium]|nr:PQQ-binding-like beta-propeller repeat protein [Alphaproteobacteria bacterium]